MTVCISLRTIKANNLHPTLLSVYPMTSFLACVENPRVKIRVQLPARRAYSPEGGLGFGSPLGGGAL
jgi:hypothetical protein